jgi:hypothetical protein
MPHKSAIQFTVNDGILSRRQLVSSAVAAMFCTGLPASADSPKGPTPALARNRLLVRLLDIPQLQTRSKMVLELDGKLLVNEADTTSKQKQRAAEVKAKSTLDYFELIALTPGEGTVAAAREYIQADAEHWVAGNTSTIKLREACLNTVAMKHENLWQQLCQTEPLLKDEVELLLSPINSQVLELLLPDQPAKGSEPWDISADAARELFNLEAAHQSTLVARISKVEKGVASIDLSGEVHGTANSVSTHLNISGNFQAKLASQCAIVSWVGLVIKETRAISQAEPGFEITARIRLIRDEADRISPVTRDQLVAMTRKPNELPWIIKTGSAIGRYTFLADRKWKTYIDTGEEAIFRLIDNNSVIAQCNVTRLPSLDPGKQLTLTALQQEIRQSLNEKFSVFVEASEKVNANKLKMMRVVVSGQSEEVPIQWIYAHMSDDSGQRVSLVFTMGANLVERFAAADEQICNSFGMFNPPAKSESGTPEVAPKLISTPSVKKK